MANEIERKSFTGIELKKDKPGAFTARIATLNVIDKDGDVTLPGAFPKGKTILISAYMHGSWAGELPVGKGVITETGNDVLVEGEFYLNTNTGKEHYETIKNAPELQEWSYGFQVIDAEMDGEWNEQPVSRILKQVDVFEASPVLRGAGVGTATLAIKNKKDEGTTYAEQAEAVLAAVKDLSGRTKSLADLRRKEGRDLSPANREKMTALRAEIEETGNSLKDLLALPEPPAADKSGRAELSKAMRLLNEIYGGKN